MDVEGKRGKGVAAWDMRGEHWMVEDVLHWEGRVRWGEQAVVEEWLHRNGPVRLGSVV